MQSGKVRVEIQLKQLEGIERRIRAERDEQNWGGWSVTRVAVMPII